MSQSAAATLAALHAEAFDAPWSAEAFADLLSQPGVAAEVEADGFILIRVVADEAEILTLAVRPAARRAGLGLALVQRAAVAATALGAERLFLEVAEDNAAARALYGRAGFEAAGRRKAYYARRDGPAADALILTLNLPGRLPRA
ncbi:GNAT family N-acetyltransferase [Brevundimonas sp. S30B]|uniref:GNAT family N-acetyltransferase n=1 Tax=unclassified Brevundimonas TaxID=2622653 RepID=UPI001071882C|nr:MULTISPECIES: GNAT family N-acetyltransferase [unclassified Brevundimonas]QBX37156.1 GNAT family N-acetyltransferase [Brevundimonas sp. MF30-B]TFW04049.1 GNAT family N-acetyltransferase [Brevundimonas sp. S30B]